MMQEVLSDLALMLNLHTFLFKQKSHHQRTPSLGLGVQNRGVAGRTQVEIEILVYPFRRLPQVHPRPDERGLQKIDARC